MRTWSIVIYLAARVAGDGLYNAASNVVSLTADKANTALTQLPDKSSEGFVLVEFYMEWCGHCQHFAPTYEELANRALLALPSVKVAAINCANHKNDDGCNANHIKSFPTIILFGGPSHVEVKHEEARTAKAMLDWLANHTGLPLADHTLSEATLAPKAVPAPAKTVEAAATPKTLTSADARRLDPAKTAAKAGGGEAWARTHAAKQMAAARAAAGGVRAPLVPRPEVSRPVPYDDLFAAVEYSLRHEVPPADGESLSSDKLRALKHWLKALTRGLPTSPDGGQLRASIEVVAQKLEGAFAGREALTAARYNAALDAAEPPWGATSWTHCTSPHPELHGYPCSLWLLFHSLLAHATDDDAFSVVLAIQEYVHAFFSCRECADNFEKEWQSRGVYEPRANAKPMSLRHRWALWLWRAHNSVSERLAATQVCARVLPPPSVPHAHHRAHALSGGRPVRRVPQGAAVADARRLRLVLHHRNSPPARHAAGARGQRGGHRRVPGWAVLPRCRGAVLGDGRRR